MAQIFSLFTIKTNVSLESFRFTTHFKWMCSWVQSNEPLHAQNSLIENEEGCKPSKVDGSLFVLKENTFSHEFFLLY